MYKCFKCSQCFVKINNLFIHLKIHHKCTSNDVYVCAQGKCSRQFQIVSKFKKHLVQKHSNPVLSSSCSSNQNIPSTSNNSALSISSECDNFDLPSNLDEFTSEDLSELVRNASVTFCAKLYAKNSLPRSFIQTIIEEVSEYLTTGYLPILKNKVIQLLENKVPLETFNEVKNMFRTLETPFEGLTTEYLRLKCFEKSKHFKYPDPYVIGHTLGETVNKDGVKTLETENVQGQHLPMTFTLKGLLEIPKVFDKMKSNISFLKSSKVTQSILQGEIWQKKISMFPSNIQSNVFPIVLYFDDFEAGNPLGSHSGIHKTGVVYYTLPAIPQQYLSKLENIFFALIFISNDRVQFGNQSTFKPLVDELVSLELNGIEILTTSGTEKVYFVVLAVVGDNLGLHSILGYCESFTSNYFCRFCKSHKSVTVSQVTQSDDELRTLENYDADIIRNNLSDTGISDHSVWCAIPSFNNIDNFVVDIMHDLLEGVCRYDMALVIQSFINSSLFSLEDLNFRIKHFSYGKNISNLPPLINKEHLKKNCLIMSASEMLTFVIFFPLIIGDRVPEDNEVWHLYLLLKDIVDAVMVDEFDKGFPRYLQGLVSEHHEMYLKVFKQTLKPKHHFLVHYHRVLILFGPLKQLWCMRFEAKHAELKGTAKSISTRRNLPLTLAIKCQLHLSHRLLSNSGLRDEFSFGSGEVVDSSSLVGYHQYSKDIAETVLLVNWADLNGTKYFAGCTLHIDIIDDMPIFGKVKHVLVCDHTCIFVVLKYETLGFDIHYHSYEVVFENVGPYVVINHAMLKSVKVLPAVKGSHGTNYVLM